MMINLIVTMNITVSDILVLDTDISPGKVGSLGTMHGLMEVQHRVMSEEL